MKFFLSKAIFKGPGLELYFLSKFPPFYILSFLIVEIKNNNL